MLTTCVSYATRMPFGTLTPLRMPFDTLGSHARSTNQFFSSGGRKKRTRTIMASFAKTWQLADVFVTAKGAKQCLLSDGSGKHPVVYIPDELLVAPFGFSSWEESTRKNLELRCTPSVESFFTQLDDWARAYLLEHSERLFKKQLTAQQIEENYKSPLHKKGDYPALLRSKINTSGTNQLRIWDAQGGPAEEPTGWKDLQVKPRLHIRSLWIMGPSFGFTIECTDLQLHPPCRACPFNGPELSSSVEETYGKQ